MPKPTSKRLIIDSGVLQAAGGEGAVSPRATLCRDFLNAVYEICHSVVLSLEINNEWKAHHSRFSRRWRRYMYGSKKVILLNVATNQELLIRVERTTSNEKDREAIRKDFHLIVAALASERIIVSLDDTARRLFSQAADATGELREIMWVNPEKSEEEAIAWLENGAPAEARRQLGLGQKDNK